ncbi:hypothetical protein Q9295_02810 [Xinfangfangia sp. CPCC 101601]|uniref:Flagellar protein FlgN n=1 Tax=Pseudogemmobacter lacusdianii TaxID=3069608 RepID=A0ABU0VUQ8_9RHOB|nr:hypothetical protein [Xinfangfangia sp. CPCC 101601]MDQ2065293.1 hypothetical protein [Xinfangfangia sp. CPCC 101601]
MNVERARLRQLQDMASLVLDSRSQKLRQENAVKDALLRQLADLEPRAADLGLLWSAQEQAQFAYQQWAAQRRAVLNQQLAAQTALCLKAAEEGRQAFGKVHVLEVLTQRLPDRR